MLYYNQNKTFDTLTKIIKLLKNSYIYLPNKNNYNS